MKANSNGFLLNSRTTACLSLAIVSLFVEGCASVNHLREAQDSFNQAAAAENAARFNERPADATASLASAPAGYASALLSLDKLEPKDQQSLQRDGLWGTALTLKALCQWRLGKYADALNTAAQSQIEATNQIYPRDRALLAALPGLIKTDQAYAKVFSHDASLADVEALLVGPRGAVADIQQARALVDTNHPVQVYLIQAQLAAYRNFTVAMDRLNNHAVVPAGSPARADATSQLSDLNRLLKVLEPGTPGRELVLYWARLCGLAPPPP